MINAAHLPDREEIYFQAPYFTLYYNKQQRLARAVWNGFLNSEEFRTASNTCLDLVEEQQTLYWLADNRKMKAIRQHDQDWFVQSILPRLAKSSLRKMATLVSEDIFNRMAVASLESKANEVVNFDTYYFKSEKEALAWLTESALENSMLA